MVYEKAEKNENIGAMLSELEEMALNEAEENCGLLRLNGQPITKEMFQTMSDTDKEQVMYYLSGIGLEDLNSSMTDPVITITLSSHIQMVLGCTMFSILNRLEKLDGAYNVIHPKATLEIIVPLGAKKGLLKCEMLIMALYPWLSVSEKSSNVVSATMPSPTPKAEPTTNDTQSTNKLEKDKSKKKSLLAKLFGK
ncbi:MAG: hypothetical protein LIO62_01845 [Clostridiales bacterium]|nr:hypothetical protein [Clostridiales bacterium]